MTYLAGAPASFPLGDLRPLGHMSISVWVYVDGDTFHGRDPCNNNVTLCARPAIMLDRARLSINLICSGLIVSGLLVFLWSSITLHALPIVTSPPQTLCSDSNDLPLCCVSSQAIQSSHSVRHESSDPVTWPWLAYKSSTLEPPVFEISRNVGTLAPGHILLGQYGPEARQDALLMMTAEGDLIYSLPSAFAANAQVVRYRGEQFIAFWSGYDTPRLVGHDFGQINLLNSEYEVAHVVCSGLGVQSQFIPQPPCNIDTHESFVTTRGTVLVIGYNLTQTDLSTLPKGTTDGWVYDNIIYELDIATSEILFSWRVSEHIPVAESRNPIDEAGTYKVPWDAYHVNSIQLVGSDYLISIRHTWSVYLISGHDGRILWQLDGETGGDFSPLPAEAHFRWQHTARAHNVSAASMTVSLFNNYNTPRWNGTRTSSMLTLVLELPPDKTRANPARLVRRLESSLYSTHQGSYTIGIAGTRNQLVDYGGEPVIHEFGPEGDLIWEGRFGAEAGSAQTYRVSKGEWTGTPLRWNPSLVVEAANATLGLPPCATGYVSWNGATEVSEWAVYHAPDSRGALARVGVVPKLGFETAFSVPSEGCLQLGAVQHGSEVRRSNTVCSPGI